MLFNKDQRPGFGGVREKWPLVSGKMEAVKNLPEV